MEALWEKALIGIYDQQAAEAPEDTDALSCIRHDQVQDICCRVMGKFSSLRLELKQQRTY